MFVFCQVCWYSEKAAGNLKLSYYSCDKSHRISFLTIFDSPYRIWNLQYRLEIAARYETIVKNDACSLLILYTSVRYKEWLLHISVHSCMDFQTKAWWKLIVTILMRTAGLHGLWACIVKQDNSVYTIQA